jgi:chromosome segregation ATPase
MSKQQIQTMKSQYATYEQQLRTQIAEDTTTKNQISAIEGRESSLRQSLNVALSNSNTQNAKLNVLKEANTKLSEDIATIKTVIDRVHLLLEGYSEYVAPESSLPTTLMSETAVLAEMACTRKTDKTIRYL